MGLNFKTLHMARKPITDGTKKKQHYFLIEERNFDLLGKKRLNEVIDKAVTKEVELIKKGKVHNQVNLLDSIAEIENQNQPAK